MEWNDISVFISSTFNDMHAERDYILKNVFPQSGTVPLCCESFCLKLLIDEQNDCGVLSEFAVSDRTSAHYPFPESFLRLLWYEPDHAFHRGLAGTAGRLVSFVRSVQHTRCAAF
ncbi:MAG: DUF4062 domain-containing protein [Clostridia bacterium]|nr:DUF4062 domain-containing protein [Clostridia bacterium]